MGKDVLNLMCFVLNIGKRGLNIVLLVFIILKIVINKVRIKYNVECFKQSEKLFNLVKRVINVKMLGLSIMR